MFKDITFGQYVPTKSIIHAMDPRVKLLTSIGLLILIFLCSNFLSLGITVLLVVLLMLLSKVSIKIYLKSLKMIIVVLLVTSALNLFYGTGDPLFKFGFITITQMGIYNSLFVTVRIFSLVLISSVLTVTTSTTDLADAIESIFSPLKKIGLSVHEFSMMMTIALRFIPTLLEEAQKIINAQKARGADFYSGNFITRIKSVIPILVPLFMSSFRRAYDLAMAMESRCYTGGLGRTKMKVLKFKQLDLIATLAVIIFITFVLIINYYLPGAFK